jgi:hypothetical protein
MTPPRLRGQSSRSARTGPPAKLLAVLLCVTGGAAPTNMLMHRAKQLVRVDRRKSGVEQRLVYLLLFLSEVQPDDGVLPIQDAL